MKEDTASFRTMFMLSWMYTSLKMKEWNISPFVIQIELCIFYFNIKDMRTSAENKKMVDQRPVRYTQAVWMYN